MYDNPTGIRNALMMTPAGQQVVQQYQGGGITQTDVPLADIAGGQGRFFEKFVYPTGIESIENTLGLVPTRPDQRRLPLLPKGSQEDWIQPERGVPYGHSLPSIGGVYSRGPTAEEGPVEMGRDLTNIDPKYKALATRPNLSQYDVGSPYDTDWPELAKRGLTAVATLPLGFLPGLAANALITKGIRGKNIFELPTIRPKYPDSKALEKQRREAFESQSLQERKAAAQALQEAIERAQITEGPEGYRNLEGYHPGTFTPKSGVSDVRSFWDRAAPGGDRIHGIPVESDGGDGDYGGFDAPPEGWGGGEGLHGQPEEGPWLSGGGKVVAKGFQGGLISLRRT